MDKPDLFGLAPEQLEELFVPLGLQRFRARQVFQWLYQKSAGSFAEMHNLGQPALAVLEEHFSLLPQRLRIVREQRSADRLTEKLLLELPDGNCVETVLMHHDYGYSACVSSQAGCAMRCAFCASGLQGCVRSLDAAEILAQVFAFNSRLAPLGQSVARVVVMGSGEPLLNFDNVLAALAFLHRADGCNMSYRNMTVSTCGIIDGIHRLQELGRPVNLAVSLHAVRDGLRSELMPVNKLFPFAAVLEAAEAYSVASRRQVTYEYILIKDKNDSAADAELLSKYLRGKHACVNLIPVNPVPEKGFARPAAQVIERFAGILRRHRINVTLRREMGRDIDAACGQLRARFLRTQESK